MFSSFLNNLVPWILQVLIVGSLGAALPALLVFLEARPGIEYLPGEQHRHRQHDGKEEVPLAVLIGHGRLSKMPCEINPPACCRFACARVGRGGGCARGRRSDPP